MGDEPQSPWDLFGGDAVVEPLLRDFYANHVAHSRIAHLFPPDLEPVLMRQFAFLRMYWGGPDTYNAVRRPIGMRALHLSFPIHPEDADTWVSCMEAAVANSAMPKELHEVFIGRLRQMAKALINQGE